MTTVDPMDAKCKVCEAPCYSGIVVQMCDACEKAYARWAETSGSYPAAIMAWAAARARRAERRRVAAKAKGR